MNALDAYELLAGHDWQVAVVLALAVWFIGVRGYGRRAMFVHFPKIAATTDLVIVPLAVIALGDLIGALTAITELTEFDPRARLLTQLVLYLVSSWVIAQFVECLLAAHADGSDTASLPGLQRGALYGGSMLIAITVFLAANDYSIKGVFLSTGAAAAIAAFALQKTLGDLFSGIALSLEKPFRVGDWIELSGGSQGQVVDLNWRATRLRGWDNATLVIPNGALATQGFKNLHGSGHVYAPWYEIHIPAIVDPRFAKALLLEAVLRCDKVLKHPLPTVRLADASTRPYTYLVWVHFANYPAMFAGREEVFREIHYALDRAGVQVAPPTHELHTRKADNYKAEPPTTLLALQGLDIAGWLTEAELESIALMSRHRTFETGAVILREGEVAECFDIVLNGIVELSIALPNGSTKALNRLSPGEYFGITSMATSNPSKLSFTALTDVSLITVDLECLRSVVGGRPELANAFAEVVKQRLDAAEEVRRKHSQSGAKPSFHEVLRSIEESIWAPRHR